MTTVSVDVHKGGHDASASGFASRSSWLRASADQTQTAATDVYSRGGSLGSINGVMSLSKNAAAASMQGFVARSDSTWATDRVAPGGRRRAVDSLVHLKKSRRKRNSCYWGEASLLEELHTSVPRFRREGLHEARSVGKIHLSLPLGKTTSTESRESVDDLSRLSSASADHTDSTFGFCMLTFRNSEMGKRFRESRLLRHTSCTLGISFLFLIVLSSLWPVYGKVPTMLGVPRLISLLFTVGCGSLIGVWLLHACIVGFRRKLKVPDKAAVQFTLALIALTLLLALGWANAYLFSDGGREEVNLSVAAHGASSEVSRPEDLYLREREAAAATTSMMALTPSAGSLGIRSAQSSVSSGQSDLFSTASHATSAAESVTHSTAEKEARAEEAREFEDIRGNSGSAEKDSEFLQVSTFALLLIMTLSIVAVYSFTDFAPTFLARSWPLYLVFPIFMLATIAVSNILFSHNLAAELTYVTFLLSAVIWGCGFANRYFCEAERRTELSTVERAYMRAQKQASKEAENKAEVSPTAVEQLQQLAGSALQLVKALRVAVAEGAAPFASESLFLQLHSTIAELITTLSETDDLYSCRIVHSLIDTAAGQRWLSAIHLRGPQIREELTAFPETSLEVPSVPISSRHKKQESREMINSSCLLEDGPWMKWIGTMDSSAPSSGSDLQRLASEEASLESLTCTEFPKVHAAALAAATITAAGGEDGGATISKRVSSGDGGLSLNSSPYSHAEDHVSEMRDEAMRMNSDHLARTPPTPAVSVITSIARALFSTRRSQTRKHSMVSSCKNKEEQVAGLVDDYLEMQLQPLGSRELSVTGCEEIIFSSPAPFGQTGIHWDLDVLTLAQTHQGALQHVGWTLLRPFASQLGCGAAPIIRLVQHIEARYDPELPYHTATHAAQVAHSAMVLNDSLGLDPSKEKMGTFCLALAAVAHDVGHLGKTNGFLQLSRHPLATIYNDQSIMENFHSSVLFRIINEIPPANVFRCQSTESYQALRQQIISLILATDMKEHVDLVNRCRIRRNSPDFSFARREEDAVHVRKMLIKMADLSHALLCWKDHFIWTCKISEEFYRQGDAERRLKLPISPVCNRECHQFLAQNQVAFLKILVEPLLIELEGIEQTTETSSFISTTLRKRYENNVERWTALDNSGIFIVFDNDTLSRGFYRTSEHVDGNSTGRDME